MDSVFTNRAEGSIMKTRVLYLNVSVNVHVDMNINVHFCRPISPQVQQTAHFTPLVLEVDFWSFLSS